MKAVIFHEHGPSSVLQLSNDVPKPTPGPNDVLIKLESRNVGLRKFRKYVKPEA